jgi:hypothetical protein
MISPYRIRRIHTDLGSALRASTLILLLLASS